MISLSSGMENSTLKFTNCYTYIIIIVLLLCLLIYIAFIKVVSEK